MLGLPQGLQFRTYGVPVPRLGTAGCDDLREHDVEVNKWYVGVEYLPKLFALWCA